MAVKRLRATVSEMDSSAVADFDHEVRLLRRLRHRNIVFFYGAGLDTGVPFLVTGIARMAGQAHACVRLHLRAIESINRFLSLSPPFLALFM